MCGVYSVLCICVLMCGVYTSVLMCGVYSVLCIVY